MNNNIIRSMVTCLAALLSAPPALGQQDDITSGKLQVLGPDGQVEGDCPLKVTDVAADVAGFFARVTVRQTFHNPYDRKIEAVYVFPLPQDAAVDDMVMIIGDRRIVGRVNPRDEARDIYETARAAGHVASLLDQERPNIFTQSVANIEPGAEVVIEISYVETLKYEDGVFEWVFPMVVGPRYIPGGGSATAPGEKATPTAQVPDADRISPPVIPEGMRAGHDISLKVDIEAPMAILDVGSKLHDINVVMDGATHATIDLKGGTAIPNRDFILRYSLASDEILDGVLTHADERGRYFTLVVQPPHRVIPSQLVARELIFVIDTSGSMNGYPIKKAKEVIAASIDSMQPYDTFNLITFAGQTRVLWEAPRPNTPENRREAQQFLAGRESGGGTEMMKAIEAALARNTTSDGERLEPAPIRVVCFMTDGYVGNDLDIIGAVKRHAHTTRVFSFGIGNSINRFLLDGMAAAGRGEVEYVTLADQADAAVERFHERILAPVLTDITLDFGKLPVDDVFPKNIPDLFAAKPLVVHGRLTGATDGDIILRGTTGDGPYERVIHLTSPTDAADHASLATLWARAKVSTLMLQDMSGMQSGTIAATLKQQITDLGVEYAIMTQYTSFVAVEELTITTGGEPMRIEVPVEMPEGVTYEGVFGTDVRLGFAAVGVAGKSVAGGQIFRGAGGRSAPGASAQRRRASMETAVDAEDEDDGPPSLHELLTDKQLDWDKLDEATRERLTAFKLVESLRDLAFKVARDGKDGTLTVGSIEVKDYKVSLLIHVRDLSTETKAALKAAGAEVTFQHEGSGTAIATVDVRKLDDLVRLPCVVRIRPVPRGQGG